MSTTPSSPAAAPLPTGLSTGLWRPALVLFLALSALTGLLYPYAVTGISQTVFKDQANGSLIVRQGQAVGSRLIGQSFSDPAHFWSRPSATSPMAYNAANSSGSNLGPSNPALVDAVKARVAALRALDPNNHQPIPIDLVTASASGLDPHISRAAADYQIPRVARQTHLSEAQVKALVDEHTLGTWLGFMGEPQVNVLELNLALDEARAHAH
ncbi:MAG: potassium-transporting ATPase subunit KdpC [Burkholderiales bacterium]|nr:MAG: potassium-transporting ATPase subunit KdpC [Burkholderiales bacterium]